MLIKRFQCGSIMENGYLLYHSDGGRCWIIDPGYHPELYEKYITEHHLDLREILLTHRHEDHIGAVAALMKRYHCPAAMHQDDLLDCDLPVDHILRNRDVINIGDSNYHDFLLVLHTPGHTQGSVCFLSNKTKVCFTGDTLFDTDLGRTDLAGGSEQEMIRSVKLLDQELEDDIQVLPGHETSAKMSFVRKENKEFLALLEGRSRF